MTFDEVFKIWMDSEVGKIEGRDILSTAKAKGFTSIVEWRLATALQLGMDKKSWVMETIYNPNDVLPNIIIGPYQGWSKFFDNKFTITFAQALEIPEFLEWCKTHDRIVPISENFPVPSTIILFRKKNGQLIHIEGGHRICAIAYAKKVNKLINFDNKLPLTAAITEIDDSEINNLIEFLKQGTFKQLNHG
jgi:hypothetical protein